MSEQARSTKQAIIEESFGWLKDYTVSEVDGKRMMTMKGETVPFNVATVIDEQEFLRDWLMGFALGNYHGHNYFKVQQWLELSADGLQSVMVVDANNKPMLIIPPLVSNNMGPEQYRMFRSIEMAIKQISADSMLRDNPMASAALTKTSGASLANVKQRTITDLVSDWYYAKHDIIPEVEQKIYYIRDNINQGQVKAEDLSRARPILYKAHRNEPVTQEEKDHINKLVKGQFDVDFGTGAVATPEPTQSNGTPAGQDYDPLEC
jgi:hypothetical protein